MPFEYLHSVFLCTIPPVWFYLVNPKVDALRDLANGKKDIKTRYNQYMPYSEEDKKRQVVGWLVLLGLQIVLTYYTFIA